MDTLTWKSLSLAKNERGHPLLTALLYVFCPAAAGWWQAGADPVLPFDPLHAAHSERAAGRTLRAVLEDWGFDGMIGHARTYVEHVRVFREKDHHHRITAPERLPTFKPGKLPISVRNRHGEAASRIGGWQNFYRFVRAWAFTAEDWQRGLKVRTPLRLERTTCESIIVPGQPVQLRAWQIGDPERIKLGRMVSDRFGAHALLEAILARSGPSGTDSPVQVVYRLSEDGTAERVRPRFGRAEIAAILARMLTRIRAPEILPLNALYDPTACTTCGFVGLCWEAGDAHAARLTPPAAGAA